MSCVENIDWLAVAMSTLAWARLTHQVQDQVERDAQLGKITYAQEYQVKREMNSAWDAIAAEVDTAMALHAAGRIGRSLESIAAELRRAQ